MKNAQGTGSDLDNMSKPAAFARRLLLGVTAYFRALAQPGRSWRWRTAAAFKGIAALMLVGFLLLALYTLALIPFTPSIADLRKTRNEQPSVLISVDGQRLATYKRFNREWVPLNRIAPPVANALIATEDQRFYQHHGIDFYRTAGALLRTLGGNVQGGSTITQQLARNLYPDDIGRKRSITRKIKETITALKIERTFTKKEILENYLNTVPFLYNAFGIEMAARTYFDKPAAKLSVLESATLIGMLKGNSYYNPVLNIERATARRNVVLAQMVRRGVLSEASYASLKVQPIRLDFEQQLEARGPAPHFAEHIRKWLVDWADRNDYNIYSDGLKVYTTIDSRIQATANQAVKRQMEALQTVADVEWGLPGERLLATSTGAYLGAHRQVRPFEHFWRTRSGLVDTFIRESRPYRNAVAAGADPAAALEKLRQDADFMARLRAEKTRLQAGLVAIDPTTGDVKAWVGSTDFDADQYDHVARAQRQPGSTFKPFVYGAALEQGMAPERQFIDQVQDIPMSDGTVWRPEDISPPTGRPMTMRDGLVYSKNTITAQVMQAVGPARAADFARRAGVRQSQLKPVPSLALGTSPVTLLEMAAAYGTIADGGRYHAPMMVTRVEDRAGRVLVEFSTRSERALPRAAAEDLVHMMRGAIDQGTGQAIRTQFGIRADVAGKTGTTQDNTDGWFILMHPRLVTGSWVGFNDARVTMRSSYWGQGAHNALYVVGDFFRQVAARRMIDVVAQFPRARDSWFGAAIWGPPLDWMEKLFGGETAPARPAPPPAAQRQGRESALDTVEQAVRNARETERALRRDWEALQKMLDDVLGIFR
jgi:penicillin-binding protein 1A